MTIQSDLALNLMNLFNPSSYTEFEKGFFVNRPKMEGYYFIFKDIKEPKFCLILNTSETPYNSDFAEIKDYIYIIFNIESLDEFIENLSTKYLPVILDILNQKMNKEDTKNLPYGYYYDENGELRIDVKKAREVKEIYDRYQEIESILTIANERKVNFSHIRDILHDNEAYMQMQQKILPATTLKIVNGLLAKNVKGTFREETAEDRLRAARARERKLKSISLQAQQN